MRPGCRTSWTPRATLWVTSFGGEGTQEALAIDCGPQWLTGGGGFGQQPGNRVRLYETPLIEEFVAVGGYFNNRLVLPATPPQVILSAGGDDAFIALVRSTNNTGVEGAYIRHLVLGSTGHERITGLVVDPVDQGVVVTGYFSGTNVNFDPYGPVPVYPGSYAGGTDIFVARYYQGIIGTNGVPITGLRLDWVYTTGTAGNDSGAAVGVDAWGRAYATGYVHGGANGRQVWLGKVEEYPDFTPNATTLSSWGPSIPSTTGFIWGGPGDDAGLGLAVDGLDRVILTGQFAQTVDLDPTGGIDSRTSAGGLDLFVTRMAQTYDIGDIPYPIQYDGTFTIGGSYDEVGSAVAIEGLRSQRLAHAGWFGAGGSPNGYTVDFDPGPGIANKSGNGQADAFVSSFLPTIPASVKSAVSLTLDASESLDDATDYPTMLNVLRAQLIDAGTTPQNQTVAVNAIMFDFWDGGANMADQIMPWTVLSASNARVFARRLAHQPRLHTGAGTPIDDGIRKAWSSQEGDRISGCYRSILVIADGENRGQQFDQGGLMRTARDDVLNTVDPVLDINVHQINAVAVRGDINAFNATFRAFSLPPTNPPQCDNQPFPLERQYLPSSPFYPPVNDPGYLVKSDASVPQVPSQTWGLGLALHTDGCDPLAFPGVGCSGSPLQFEHPTYSAAVQLMLKRSTRCPGDFDRDGDVDPTDMTLFNAAYVAQDPSADWNMDGGLSPTTCVVNIDDFYTFGAAYALGCCGP